MKTIQICAIFGTRSWARVLLRASVEAFSPSVQIVAVDDSCSEHFAEWLKTDNLSVPVRISSRLPKLGKNEVGLAIVANSAPLHFSTTQRVLSAGYHAVVEKPLTFSRVDSLSLVDSANESHRHLFSTNIPLFTGYLHRFRAHCVAKSVIHRVQIDWTDPAFELRHGTRKNYDSATPLIFDVVPHTTSILWALFDEKSLGGNFDIVAAKGGAQVRIFFKYGDVPVTVNLARNADRRIRRIQVVSEEGNRGIDFSVGPPRIEQSTRQSASEKLPSVRMLEAVRSSCSSRYQDPRLTVKTNILANELVDKVIHSYVEQQVAFLQGPRRKQKEGADADNAYRYARKEAQSVSMRLKPNLTPGSALGKLLERYEEFQ